MSAQRFAPAGTFHSNKMATNKDNNNDYFVDDYYYTIYLKLRKIWIQIPNYW